MEMYNATAVNGIDLSSARLPEGRPKRHESYGDLLIGVIRDLRQSSWLLETMRSVPRWERFLSQGEEPRNRDMHELGHALNTARIARFVAKEALHAGRITRDERAGLILTALIHDLGELGAGDVTFDQKHQGAAEKELEFFHQNLSRFFPRISGAGRAAIQSLYDGVAMGKDQTRAITYFFKMVEYLGYLTTSLEEHERKAPNVDYLALCANVWKNTGGTLSSLVHKDYIALGYLVRELPRMEALFETLAGHRGGIAKDVDFTLWANIIGFISRYQGTHLPL